MNNFKRQYRDLEMSVFASLREKVNNSKVESKFVQEKAISIPRNVFSDFDSNMVELVILNYRLTFLDSDGLHYSAINVSLETLIDLLDKI